MTAYRFFPRFFYFFCLALLISCQSPSAPTKKIQGLNGLIEVTVPNSWYESREMHKSADIQAGEDSSESYLLVVSEKREAITSKTMDGYSTFTRQALARSLKGGGMIYGPWYPNVGGRKAVRCEIRGTSIDNDNDLVYIHEVVETPQYFHQVVAWTTAAKYEKNRPTLMQVVESFRENSP